MKLDKANQLFIFIAASIILSSIIHFLVVYPALYGTFEFDDIGNLSRLAEVNDIKSGLFFAFERIQINLGRPISMLTFAAQSDSWPANPFPFKLVNLLIHYLNGILILVILIQLLGIKLDKKTTYILSFAIYLFWLFAPIHIFSVFYVIQRMTLLSTFFVLSGVLSFVYFRPRVCDSQSLKTLFFLTISYFMFLAFGILSKENAILLPVFILIIEYSFFSSVKYNYKHRKLWNLIFLWLPIIVLMIYLLLKGKLYYDGSHLYPFTSIERLLNEAIIIWGYIKQIIIPEYGSYGLIHDDYKIVRSITENLTVFISVIGILLLIPLAVYFRRINPLVFFAILWFLGGHLLESTVIQLELKFDHRNYLPSLGIIFLITILVFYSIQYSKSKFIKSLIFSSLFAYSCLYLLVLHQTADAWRSSSSLSNYQIQFHPESKRAQAHLISFLFNTGQYKEAAELLNYLEHQHPKDIGIQLNTLMFSSFNSNFTPPPKKKYLRIAKTGPFERTIDNVLLVMFDCIINGHCKTLSHQEYREIITALQQNPRLKNNNSIQLMAVQKAKSFSQEGRWQDAIDSLLTVPESKRTRIEFYFLLVQYQYMAKQFEAARQTIETIKSKIKYSPIKQLSLQKTIDRFLYHIELEINSKHSKSNIEPIKSSIK